MTARPCRAVIECLLALAWLGLMAFASGSGAQAQPAPGSDEYLIGVWTAENGLPNSSVTSIAQTPDGYLWVGTYNGLARFDGERVVKFDPSVTPALRHARVRRLAVDAVGTLWISTYDGSLTSFRDGEFTIEHIGSGELDAATTLIWSGTNEWVFQLYSGELLRKRLSHGTNRWEELQPPVVASGALACAGRDGEIWYRSRDQQLWRLRDGLYEPIPFQEMVPGRAINCLVGDAQGRVWMGTDQGIALWDGNRFQNVTPTNGPAEPGISFLHPARDGSLWAIADGKVRKAVGRQWVFEGTQWRDAFTGLVDRLGAVEDDAGGIWLYHYGKGLLHIRPYGRERQLTAQDNFPGDRVDCLFRDREGSLWAGVDRGGLVRLREKRFQVLSILDGAAVKATVSVCEDDHGAIWVGTYGAGLNRWDFGQLTEDQLPGSRRGEFVFSVYPDRDDRLWLSLGDEDLFVRDAGQIRAINPLVHGVKVILVDRSQRVWVGTKNGLWLGERGQFRALQVEQGIRRSGVRALAEDALGRIWAGGGDGTLYRIEEGRMAGFRANDELAAQPIWSLHVDQDGTIWAGTFRAGLLSFSSNRFTRFTTREGLPDDVICQILDDEAGRLWIGSHQGIFTVAKSELRAVERGESQSVACKAYGRFDGLPAIECSGGYQPACWRGHDGRLWFTTLKGVVSVHPDDLKPNQQPPPVVIEETLVDGEAQRPEPAQVHVPGRTDRRLIVPPGKRQVEFQYTGLSLISPDRVRFRYKLEGQDRDWFDAGPWRSARYSYLKPGDYTFRVVACNNDGVWNTEGDALRVTVQPHFYETWWFYGIVVLMAVATVAVVVRHLATRRLRLTLERMERQRAVERDRARIAKDIHDDLGAGLTQITLLSELARRDSDREIKTHLGQISESARGLTRAMDEIVWAVNPQNDTLESLVTYMSKFAQEYLNLAGIRCRLDVPAHLPFAPLRPEVRHNLFLAMKEAINNVVKHAGATEVHLRLLLKDHSFIVVIEDNGHGFVTGVDGESDQRGLRFSSGHGVGNLHRRLAAVGGHCEIQSRPGAGTRVELIVEYETVSPVRTTAE